jgi:glycosyltransferase involved in cell wall biosynthesis
MKRICIVNRGLRIGGVERKIADIAQELKRNDADARVDLILEQPPSADANENIFLQRAQTSGARIFFKPARGVPLFFVLLWYALRHKPDVMLAFSRRPVLYALWVRELLWWRALRVMVGNDSITSQALMWYVPQPLLRRILKMQMRRLYPRAARLLVPSERSKRDLMENFGVPPEKIRVLKNWTRYAPTQTAPKTFDLIYVGRVDGVKQLARLVEIAHAVREHLPLLRVLLVGDGEETANVQQRVRELGMERCVEWVGFQADVAKYLAQAKIFCLTSKFEGMPLAALEAMACGLPIVTTMYPGADELVHSGATGFVCANEQEFCDVVVALLTDDVRRAEMGNRAREFVQREHGAHVLGAYVKSLVLPD